MLNPEDLTLISGSRSERILEVYVQDQTIVTDSILIDSQVNLLDGQNFAPSQITTLEFEVLSTFTLNSIDVEGYVFIPNMPFEVTLEIYNENDELVVSTTESTDSYTAFQRNKITVNINTELEPGNYYISSTNTNLTYYRNNSDVRTTYDIKGTTIIDILENENFAVYPGDFPAYTNWNISITNTSFCGRTKVSVMEECFCDTLQPKILGGTVLCENSYTTLFLDDFYETYLWSTGQDDYAIEVTDASQNYFATVETEVGCIAYSDTVSLYEQMVPEPVFEGYETFCPNDSITLSLASDYDTYIWSDSSLNNEFTVSDTNNHVFVVVGINGCYKISDTLEPSLFDVVDPLIEGDTVHCQNEQSVLTLNEVYESYAWSTGDSEPSISGSSQDGEISVTVMDFNGCELNSDTVILVEKVCTSIEEETYSKFSLFPNPINNGTLNISFDDWNDYSSVSLIDLEGNVLSHYDNINGDLIIDVPNYSGIVFVVANTIAGQSYSQKIVIE